MSRSIFELSSAQPIFVCSEPTSMVLGIPGLLKKIEEDAKYKPYSKGIYVFISKNFSKMKIIFWDRTGYAMLYKCVVPGTFRIEWKGGYRAVTGVMVRELLEAKPTGRQRKEQ